MWKIQQSFNYLNLIVQVGTDCWMESEDVENYFLKQNRKITEEEIRRLWATFHNSVVAKIQELQKNKSLQAIIWQNTLTDEKSTASLSKDKYIVQIWKKFEVYILS